MLCKPILTVLFVKSAQGIFMSLTDRAYEIVADVFEHFESDVLLQLRDE